MSIAYYIALDGEVDFDSFVSGKAIAQAAEELRALCDEHGIKPVDAFISQGMTDLIDDLDLPDLEEEWFDADEGIEWVNAVVELVGEEGGLMDEEAVVEELEEYLYVLISAKKANIRWRLELDA